MDDINEIKDGLIELFTDDPINWVKWIAVFTVLIATHFISVPLFNKVNYLLSWDRKGEKAKEKGNVIEATLIDVWKEVTESSWYYHATYEYIDLKGKKKKYYCFFIDPNYPSKKMELYYLDNPKKLFSVDEYHYENHKGIILIPIWVLPWVLAVITMMFLQIPIPQ
ncbi:MAG: hypothetical protein QM266_01780 [Bacillota bacterium]|jgi:hypothetical protein|nr:hypothetical protein [Bacillota bacterium]